MRKHPCLRIFLTSFAASMLVLTLLWGLAVVDYECRRIGFGDGETLLYRLTGENPPITCIDDGI